MRSDAVERLRALAQQWRKTAGDDMESDLCEAHADQLEASIEALERPQGVYGSEVLCESCAVTFCPDGEQLHFHHDGCPACHASDIGVEVATGRSSPA